ncbi:Uma2 family endonuclease [Kineococcus sp. NBC_00420]|uniref:Uma2 family endonuclease n=1 Tax=Kineococcus sp. NBC_00420 TaxID=2903564 RepID=UPI002E2474A4
MAAEMDDVAVSVLHREWAFEDLLTLPDDGYRYEIMDGQLIVTPPPPVVHQDVIDNLRAELGRRVAPDVRVKTGVGVRVPRMGPERYVIPDLLVASGARPALHYEPESVRLAVEVTSPSTELRDRGSKKELYEAHGVACYLLVDLSAEAVTCWELERGEYRLQWRMTASTPGEGLLAGVTLGDLTREPS